MSSPLLCVTVAAPTMGELRQRRDEAVRLGADLVELRLDHVADCDVAGALADRKTPVIATCRAKWEGGAFQGSEIERLAILRSALELGAEYVDVEFNADHADLVRLTKGRRIILSLHDFDGVPVDLPARVRAMRAVGAEIVKVAVTPQSLWDNLTLLDLRDASSKGVFIGMGAIGAPTRILAAHFGSAWTYAGDGHAPGQIPIGRLVAEFRFRTISERTAIYGIVGWPLGHSVSPAMHNAALAAMNQDAVYIPMPAASADDFLEFAKALRVRGASVTIPYKVDLFQRADVADELSTKVGAANTLKRHQTKWMARNTDVNAFLAPLKGKMNLRGARAAVLGSGGAARGVAVALATAGAEVCVYARNAAKAEEISRLIGRKPTPLPVPPGSWDLLVNTTPLGTAPKVDESPFEGPFDGKIAYDLIYNPPATKFLRSAAAAGCETINGLDMLIAQGEDQFEWWIGKRPPAGVMRQAAMDALGLSQEAVAHE